MKRYQLSDFSHENIVNAKKFIKKALYGYFEVCLDEKIDEAFSELECVSFGGDDRIIIQFALETIGNDLLTALGASDH